MDLNADLGEGFGRWQLGDDEALLDVVTSANVACGFHAGDAETMRRSCALAARRDVAVGAQVGYRDLAGFGRRFIEYDLNQLRDELIYQVGALRALADAEGARVRYLKPHGALYHAVAHVDAIVEAAQATGLPVLCAPGSPLATAAGDALVPTYAEGFADRAYRADGTLLPRDKAGAVIVDQEEVVARALLMVVDQRVIALDGTVLPHAVDSICLHGDTPGAVVLARAVRAALEEADVPLTPFIR
ncbi:5-oxoprolinase subunit PxpA [Catellatospora sp. KI3]|uniref:LamB/YcsF family protein n=1 Tax=Catellatospora sp. KI3 TaxID=3041620 RepID=UPI002482EC63|nr:5-oxoprolinase subunit PxpA [Catellatospora sp. KI3]MDI1464231.1 5-oxoprolinase subunit PxpA [Catellatospora sp. KI3]